MWGSNDIIPEIMVLVSEMVDARNTLEIEKEKDCIKDLEIDSLKM
jgi:hypothetical protein